MRDKVFLKNNKNLLYLLLGGFVITFFGINSSIKDNKRVLEGPPCKITREDYVGFDVKDYARSEGGYLPLGRRLYDDFFELNPKIKKGHLAMFKPKETIFLEM